jgi:hypothetical protein
MSSKKPICWTCKHGLCVKQKMLTDDEDTVVDEFGDIDQPQPTEIVFYTNMCFWNPISKEPCEPIELPDVTECSRYEARVK